MKRLYIYLKPQLPRMILGLIIKFTGTLMDLFLPMLLAYMIDNVAKYVQRTGDYSRIYLYGFLMLACALIAVWGNVVANRMAARVARNTTEALRHDLFEKVSYLSCSKIDSFSVASLEARLTTDTYNLHNMIGMMQRIGIRAPILLIGGICITMSMDPILTLILILVLPFMAVVATFVSKKGVPLFTAQQKSVDGLVRVIRENITGVRVIKALSKSEYEKDRFDKASKNLVECETKASLTMAITNPIMNFLLNTGLAVVIIVGAIRVSNGTTHVGTIVAFLSYFTIILNAMLTITRIFVNYTKGIASANRISEVLDSKNDLEIMDIAKKLTPNHIEFNDVSFSYYRKKNNISDINFKLKRGQSLGIIGATGSGKSTIVSVLMRLYDIDSGEILINGRDVRSIPVCELHRMFGIVFQSDTIFADTIKSNIDFGRHLSDEKIERAIELSQAKEFVDSLYDKEYHMLTAKGTNLSGGQKQRILLARAMAGNPDILVLDDSSSALDYKTDSKLRCAIAENCQDTTTIIIAQRISSIRHCDHILVLDEGKIIGSGTHDELTRCCDVYSQISALQMGGAVNG